MYRESNSSVLVVSPHPDDETFGCGGTIKLLTNAGIPVDVVYLTRGELGLEAPEAATPLQRQELAKVRMREAQAACAILGVRRICFLDGQDGRLAECRQIVGQLANLILQNGYGRVFCPGEFESHSDHHAAYHWVRQALSETKCSLDLWCYEVWTPLQPNIHVPIDETMDAKCEAAQAHVSQLTCHNYYSAFRGLAAYRALACPPSKYAEAFFIQHAQRTD